ncbi:MAG: hypothetical protein ACRDQY_13970 [Pseudonocardiaceae bacterium]
MTLSGELVEPGLVESAFAFVRRNVGVRAELADGVRRVEIPGLPTEPVREALVNVVIHRDYLLAHTDVELGLYPDRLEIVSPGRLREFNGSAPEFVVGEESLTVVLWREHRGVG